MGCLGLGVAKTRLEQFFFCFITTERSPIGEIDLLIIGTGPHMLPLSPTTRRHINDLGIRLEVQDTRNAAAQFNLLATERGVQQVAAAMIPIGWMEAR